MAGVSGKVVFDGLRWQRSGEVLYVNISDPASAMLRRRRVLDRLSHVVVLGLVVFMGLFRGWRDDGAWSVFPVGVLVGCFAAAMVVWFLALRTEWRLRAELDAIPRSPGWWAINILVRGFEPCAGGLADVSKKRDLYEQWDAGAWCGPQPTAIVFGAADSITPVMASGVSATGVIGDRYGAFSFRRLAMSVLLAVVYPAVMLTCAMVGRNEGIGTLDWIAAPVLFVLTLLGLGHLHSGGIRGLFIGTTVVLEPGRAGFRGMTLDPTSSMLVAFAESGRVCVMAYGYIERDWCLVPELLGPQEAGRILGAWAGYKAGATE